jgi:hypothetical protein
MVIGTTAARSIPNVRGKLVIDNCDLVAVALIVQNIRDQRGFARS